MAHAPNQNTSASLAARWDALARARPDVTHMAPYMTYLVFLTLAFVFPPKYEWAAIVIRGVIPLIVLWTLRNHLPNWGKPHWHLAVPAGIFAAWGWMAGQYLFDSLGWGGRLPLFPGDKTVTDPRTLIGAQDLFFTTVTLRITVAVITVPIVEEIFWRAFLLRAMIDWDNFDRIPLGKFTWISFLGTSLLSTLQHPDNWGVSILCWMFFNALFYWKPSISFIVIVHGVTNLALYLHVIRVADWSFW